MKGKHIQKKSHQKIFLICIMCVIIVVGYFYFHREEEIDYNQYPLLEGQIASVGDETLLIRLDDNKQYLISIAGAIDKNKGLLAGNTISIRYEGQLDINNDDIQNVKVKKYDVQEMKLSQRKNSVVNQKLSTTIQNMSLEEKVAQMFMISYPEKETEEFLKKFQPGGVLMFASQFADKSEEEVTTDIQIFQNNAKIKMFFAVDEEGGSVVRASQYYLPQRFQSPQMIYSQGGYEAIQKDTKEKDEFLKNIGINLNLAPVCDVSVNPDDFMYSRSFGKDAKETSQYVQTVLRQMNTDKMGSCLKHFPGYGNNEDTHYQIIHDQRSYQELKENDFLPFQKGIEENANMILVCHNIVDSIDNQKPASLSKKDHDILRNDLSYHGIIITDDLVMNGVKDYDSEENNAIQAILAGNDMIIASDVKKQYQAILDAIYQNKISINQIDQSVLRILYYKQILQIN